MTVKDALTGGLVDVDTDIIAIGVKTLIDFTLDVLQHYIHSLTLVVSEVKIVGDMTLGNDEGVAGRYGITIVESNTSGGFADDFDTM